MKPKMNQKSKRVPAIAIEGEKALRAAVAEVMAEHKRTGTPLAVWQDGNTVLLPADQAIAAVREDRSKYGTKSHR